ncbi:MAG: hypothetical protein WA945_00670 [Arcobacteraceae bacterium]
MILFENRAATVLYNVLKKIKNKKFLLPLNVCPIVPDTFVKAGMKFEFVDINLDTLCMDKDLILKKIKNDRSIDGILFVKTFGIDLNTETLFKEIKIMNSDIFIIDDMCPSIQKFDYNIHDSYADMALFSSGYSKYVDIGYGGYAYLKEEEFQNIFINQIDDKSFLKYKEKVLEQIRLMKNQKKELNTIYKNNIPKKYHLGDKYNNWRFSILVQNKEEILKAISKIDGLFASSHYPQVDLDYVTVPMKNSNVDKIHKEIINLFNDFRFSKEKAWRVVEIINEKLKEN